MSGGAVPLAGDEIDSSKDALKKMMAPKPTIFGPLDFTQLNVLVLIIVFSASGLVSVEDLGFVLLSSIYVYMMSKFVFPSMASQIPPNVFGEGRVLGIYVWVGGLVGLFLPLVYIFGGFAEGDRKGVEAAAPHVFLLSCQVLSEGVTFNSRAFSLPIRAFVPIFYNTRRIFTILDWIRMDFGKGLEAVAFVKWLQFGRALAVANLIFWSYNLFCFLLPVYLPRAFRTYYVHTGR
eukprot:Gb_07902 [translate_table: standard]